MYQKFYGIPILTYLISLTAIKASIGFTIQYYKKSPVNSWLYKTLYHQIRLDAWDIIIHLFAYGIRGNILKWFDSYLTNKSQFFMYDNIQSKTHSIKFGVLQGSILGPLLFIIYMNDICNVSELLCTIMYADDTSIIMSGNDLKSLIQSVNSELCLLNTWLKANKLSLNVNKTYYIVFHRARIKIIHRSIVNNIFFHFNAKYEKILHNMDISIMLIICMVTCREKIHHCFTYSSTGYKTDHRAVLAFTDQCTSGGTGPYRSALVRIY